MLYMIDKNLELHQEMMSSDNSENTYDDNDNDDDNDRLSDVKYISDGIIAYLYSLSSVRSYGGEAD